MALQIYWLDCSTNLKPRAVRIILIPEIKMTLHYHIIKIFTCDLWLQMRTCPIAKRLPFTFLFQLKVSKTHWWAKVLGVHLYFTQLYSSTNIGSHTKYVPMTPFIRHLRSLIGLVFSHKNKVTMVNKPTQTWAATEE